MPRRKRSRIERALDARRAANTAARRDERARWQRRRRVLWFGLWCVAVVVVLTLLFADRSHGAARVPIGWNAVAGARSYEAIARRPDGVWAALTLSADSAGTVAVRPESAGVRQVGWVLVSTDWRSGAWIVRLRACNGAGCSGWSNRVVLLAGIPDTLWHLQRLEAAGVLPPRDGTEFKRAAARVGWTLQPDDSVTVATIEHQEAAQLRERVRLCELFGSWAQRGGLWPCP